MSIVDRDIAEKPLAPIACSNWILNSQELPKFAGNAITRREESALPDIKISELGLKRTTVGGKSCDFSMVSSG